MKHKDNKTTGSLTSPPLKGEGFFAPLDKGLLISRDANVYCAKQHDASGEETFRMPVYRKTEKGVIAVAPEFHSNITYRTVEESLNGNIESLPEFMGDRYQCNERVDFNEVRLLQIIRDL